MAQRARADALELFIHLAREAADLGIVEPLGNDPLLGLLETLDGFALLVKIAGVLDLGFDRLHLVAGSGREFLFLRASVPPWWVFGLSQYCNLRKIFRIFLADNGSQVFNYNFRPLEQLCQRRAE